MKYYYRFPKKYNRIYKFYFGVNNKMIRHYETHFDNLTYVYYFNGYVIILNQEVFKEYFNEFFELNFFQMKYLLETNDINFLVID